MTFISSDLGHDLHHKLIIFNNFIFYSFDGNTFGNYAATNYDRHLSALVSYNGNPLIIAGGYQNSESGSTAEIYKIGTAENWEKTNDIPITGPKLYYHTAAVLGDKVYTFGGWNGNSIDRVDNSKQSYLFSVKLSQ